MKNPKKPLKRIEAKTKTIETKKLPKKDALFAAAGKSIKADLAGSRVDRARSKFNEIYRLADPNKLRGIKSEQATYDLYNSGVLRKNVAGMENPTPSPKPSATGKSAPTKKMKVTMMKKSSKKM